MKKYVKKPIVIDAFKWDGSWVGLGKNIPSGDLDYFTSLSSHIGSKNTILINTLEGELECTEGDYIIRGIQGEYYSCKEDVFQKTYDLIH